MKNKFIGIFIGMVLGMILMIAVPSFGAAKQYVLTLFERPVIVNGVEYKDAANPILNLNGRTYIPLSKIGDLTGVNYTWNATKKQVEIKSTTSSTDGPAGRKNDYLKPDTEIEEPVVPGYKGYPDSSDPAIEWAEEFGLPQPPLLSEGWISVSMLQKIESIYVGKFEGDKTRIQLYKSSSRGENVLKEFKLPDNFVSVSYSETTVDNVRMKKHDDEIYFNISDLQKTNIIK